MAFDKYQEILRIWNGKKKVFFCSLMTKQDFIAKLPASINHFGYGESKLKILEDNKLRKSACYCNKENYKAGNRSSNTWDGLYKELTTYLKKEGHIK